ncbi:MAG TPA: YdeI/OmpD-associated family protein [Micromonosporaceae bacterium]
MQPQRFTATIVSAPRGHAFVRVPFDPDLVWRPKTRHHVTGTINGVRVRTTIEAHDGERGFVLGPAWLRDCHALTLGGTVTVEISPEGPQRDDLADDIASALNDNPRAGAFFDSLAQFYRKGYLRWIDATKRRPQLRAERISEMVKLLDAGIKQRP